MKSLFDRNKQLEDQAQKIQGKSCSNCDTLLRRIELLENHNLGSTEVNQSSYCELMQTALKSAQE